MTARAGNRRFLRLSAQLAHTKSGTENRFTMGNAKGA
jgi:hypothetical protein